MKFQRSGEAKVLGRFRFGSTVIVLTPPDVLTLSPHLSLDGFVRMGERIATLSEKTTAFEMELSYVY